MNFLDINMGVLMGVEHEFGFSMYKDLDFIKKQKNTRHKIMTMRECVFGLVGSCNFTQNQRTAITRIYDEYSDKINVLKHDKFISKSRLYILPTTSVQHAIKFYLLLDHALDFEVPSEVKHLTPTLVPFFLMKGLKYDLSPFKPILGVKRSLVNRLLISVFKGAPTNPDEYGAVYIMLLKSLLEMGDFIFPEKTVFGVFAYSNADHLAIDNSTVYYNRTNFNRKVAERLISKLKKLKIPSLSKEALMNLKTLSEHVAENIIITSPNDILGTLECTLFSIENMSALELMTEESAIDMQLFSNICAEYNLSAQFITIMSNKKELLKKCIYLAATYYGKEKEILTKALELYYVMITIQYIKEEHDRAIDQTLRELTREQEAKQKVIELQSSLEGLQAKVSELTNELYNKEITNNVKDVNELHSDYYVVIKDLTRSLEEKDKEITRLKLSKDEETVAIVEEPLDIDISNKNILFVGHFEARDTASKLSTYVKNLDFVDGTLKSNGVTTEQMKKYDLLALQYQFIPHTVTKFVDTARKAGVKVGRIEGTNIDRWVECIKDTVRNK